MFIPSDSAVGTLAEAARAAGMVAREAYETQIAGAREVIALALKVGDVGVAVEVDDTRPRRRTLLKLGALVGGARVVLLRHAPRGPVTSETGMDLVYGLGLAKTPVRYSEDFEAFWTAIGRGPGSKEEAFDEWRKRGNPDPARSAFAWKAYVASLPREQVERGAIRHIRRWLHSGGHLQDYGEPAAARARAGTSPGFTPSEYPEFD